MYTYGHSPSLHAAPPISERDFIRFGSFDIEIEQYREAVRNQVSVIHAETSADPESPDARVCQSYRGGGVPVRFGYDSGQWCTLRSKEHTSELQSLMRLSYADFCVKKKTTSTSYPS